LANEKTIEECGIKNDDFLVLMIKKSPAGSKPAQPTQTPSTTAPPPTDSKSEQNVPSQERTAAETVVTGSEQESSIANIVNMGFPRELVVEAMKAAFNVPARAVELLTSGFKMPQQTHTTPQPTSQPTSHQTPQQPSHSRPTPVGGSTGVFDGLKQHPQFPMLCMLAQQGGQDALRQILEYFAQVSPPLLNLIIENKEEFIRILSTPVQSETPAVPPSVPNTPGVVRLTVTPEDERAINNIVSMGFDRNRVLEAYFLFEKDEAQTINFLLNNPENDN